ncbi:MAG: LCP family protein [bacterium]|nr:LCP family protein [bacterium]
MMKASIRNLLFVLLAAMLSQVSLAPAQAQTPVPVPNTQSGAPVWDGESRFTMLLMGMDRRPNARDTLSVRADAIFLVSLVPGETPDQNRVGILHIPRDLHFTPVNTADFVRVNSLMVLGEEVQEGYGPYYMMDTIQYNLGMVIHRYVAFDFEAFITLVDAIGGVEVSIGYTINDSTFPDMNYGYDPFYLPAGTHLLDGRRALQFARTRHNDNDFERGRRQLQVLTSIHQKITQDGMMMQLVAQAPALYDDLRDKFYSDLALSDMLQIAQFISETPAANITADVIDADYAMRYGLPEGEVLIPDFATIGELMTTVFGDDYFVR